MKTYNKIEKEARVIESRKLLLIYSLWTKYLIVILAFRNLKIYIFSPINKSVNKLLIELMSWNKTKICGIRDYYNSMDTGGNSCHLFRISFGCRCVWQLPRRCRVSLNALWHYKFYAKRIIRIKCEPFDIQIRDINFDVIKSDINYGFSVRRGTPKR